MTEDSQVPPSLRFGLFELSPESGELRKNGVRLKLSGQAIQVLVMLAEHPKRLVSREELQQKLWPGDSYGDFEHGLNAAVNRLRETLGDSATEPEYIETVPRRGYRFIGMITGHPPVPTIGEPSEITHPDTAAVALTEDTGAYQNWLKIGVWILVGAACAVTAIFSYLRFRPSEEPAVLNPVPFTAYQGTEIMPTFSPDGSQIAFAWDGDPPPGSKGFDLYVKVIGSENLLRLTHDPSEWISPAWSPDGTQIAFQRIAGPNTGMYIVPALGGPERKLRSIRKPVGSSAPGWSPNGKSIAFVDVLPSAEDFSINRLFTETLASKQLSHAAECSNELFPAFSHSGELLAYVCLLNAGTMEFGIYLVPLSGGSPRQVVRFTTGWEWPEGIAWTADDKKLILSRTRLSEASRELDDVTLADGSLRKLPFGQGGLWPAISAKGDKLAYVTNSGRSDIWRKDLLHPDAAAVKLIPSTHDQTSAQYSPDGKHIIFASNRGGTWEIWMSDTDGTHLVQMSDFKDSASGSPHWSPDSQKVAFDSMKFGHPTELYVVDISERMPRKVITNIRNPVVPSWSHDGKWIYFRAGLPDNLKVYRCPAAGGDAVEIAMGDSAMESIDGDTLYFTRSEGSAELYSMSLKQPGTKPVLEGMPRLSSWNQWAMVTRGIYFVPADAPRSIHYLDFTSKQIRQVFQTEKNFELYLSVSPDGRWIIYSQLEGQGDIMLVEHFR